MVSPLFDDPRLESIYRYWLSKRDGERLPSRANIKPHEVGPLIRLLNILEVERTPSGVLRFRHRLVGTAFVEWLGRDATGHYVDEELYGPAAKDIAARLVRIAETRKPYRRLARMEWNNQGWLAMEAVEMPLVAADGTVEMILRGAVFGPAPPLAMKPVFEPLPLR